MNLAWHRLVSGRRWLLVFGLLLTGAPALPARTILLTDEDCERMAAISADAPRLSWATYETGPGIWTTQATLNLNTKKSFLICYPLDRIPKGQRITSAEWLVPVYQVDGSHRFHVHRLIGDWGAGVCHEYRMVRPKPVAWSKPGARGVAADRNTKPTAVISVNTPGEQAINVTQDVELWYTGAAPNQGWIVSVEDQYGRLDFLSPLSSYPVGKGKWKLRITYEPE